MFFAGKMFRGARATAAWTSLGAAVSLIGWIVVYKFARSSVGPWTRGSWLVLSLLVAVAAGVITLPRWQSIVALAASVGAILFLAS